MMIAAFFVLALGSGPGEASAKSSIPTTLSAATSPSPPSPPLPSQSPPPSPHPSPSESPSESPSNQIDALWPRRDDPQVIAALDALATECAKSDDYELLWRAARWEVWIALGLTGAEKRRHGKLGLTLGERAEKLRPGALEAKYWTAIAWGAWGSSVPTFEALSAGVEWRYRDRLLGVVNADPQGTNAFTEHVGPIIALGHFYYKMPWPKHDQKKAEKWLLRALALHPEHLRGHLLYADAMKEVDQATARKELQLVLDGSEAYDPPDARRNKAWAKEMLETIR